MNFLLRQCVSTFNKLGNNKIVCYNETNLPQLDNAYVDACFERKKWAFVSDWLRLKVLYEYGGIYLDTDIQVEKSLPEEFYQDSLVLGYAYDNMICTAFIMAAPHHPFIKYLLDLTSKFPEGENIVNNAVFTQALIDLYPNFRLDGKFNEFASGCFVFPRQAFDSATFDKRYGYTIHHGMGSWDQSNNPLKRILRPVNKYLRYYCKPYGIWYQNKVNQRMIPLDEIGLENYKKMGLNKLVNITEYQKLKDKHPYSHRK